MKCRVCGSEHLSECIDLGEQPWCNDFITKDQIGHEPYYPLKVLFCNKCKTSQLDYTVKKEIMFGDHTYLSGITKSLSNHFKEVAKETVGYLLEKNGDKKLSVLDIGSNDGTQLKHYKELGCSVLGVESSKRIAAIANDHGIDTLNKFFNKETAEDINHKFDIINASGVFFHLEELHSVCEGIKQCLDKKGLFKVQFLYIKNIMENCAFDQIYHEHLLYYSIRSLEYLLELHDMEIFDCYISDIHGGSVIANVCHKGAYEISQNVEKMKEEEDRQEINTLNRYLKFSDQIKEMKKTNLKFLENAHDERKTVYGMGAPVKGNTLLNYFGVDSELIQLLVEKNKLRDGLYSPGSHIRIVMEDSINKYPDIYYVLAWNFKNEILKNNQKLIDNGVEFYFPVDPGK